MMEHRKAANCPFCDISVEAATFAETEAFRAIYNLAPLLPGHSLVVPKGHITSLMDLTDAEIGALMVFSRQVTQVLLQAFHSEGFDWTLQEGEPAGQSVPHLHLHLIPRQSGDLPQPGDWYPALMDSLNIDAIDSEKRSRLSPAEMQRIVEHLRQVWQGNHPPTVP
jgi:bis(5'-adenosyl)-triphosphatase